MSSSSLLPHAWHGAGPPLLLLPGLGAKGTSWRPFLEGAAASHRVLTIEPRGSGTAPPLTGPTTIGAMAADVLAVLDHLGVENLPVVGRSMGGMIAQELALQAPERVSRLVLASTVGSCDPHLAALFRHWAELAEAGVSAALRHRETLLWCLGSRALAEGGPARSYLEARGRADRPLDYAGQACACAAHDALPRLGRLRIPVLVVAGTDDRLTPPHFAEALGKAIPGAELCYIDGAGHLAYLEAPERFARQVLGWLGARGSA